MSWSSQGECLSVGVKAHVLFSRLLSSDDYWNFLGSDTVAEIGSKLKKTSYEEAISSLPADPHRHDLESAIKNTLFSQAEGFLFHMSSPRDKFFKTLMYRHESENLKRIFRYIASGRTSRDELRRRLYLSANSKISYDSALLSRNFAELSDALRESVYYRVLAEPLRRLASGEEKSLFPLEMALDLFVELSLHKALKKLGPDDRNRLIPIFGVRLDLYNIYILYRARTFYDMTPEEILNRLPPSRFRVTMESLRGMVRLDIDHLAEFLKNRFPQYAQLFVSALPDKNTQLSMERNIKRHIYSQARNVYGSGPPGFHTAVSYYVLKEFEISDIVRIIEYVRYGHERRDAAAYLTRPIISTGGETEWQ